MVGEQVAGLDVLQLRDRADVAVDERVGLLVLLPLEQHQPAQPLLRAVAEVDERRVGRDRAAVDAEGVDLPGERIGDGLEDERGGAATRVDAGRALAHGRGDALDEQVEQRMRAEVLRRDAAGDRVQLVGRDRALERSRDRRGVELLAGEVALHQRLVGQDDGIEKLLAVLGDEVGHLGRDGDRVALARSLGIHVRAVVQQVDDPRQLVLAADRELDRDATVGELLLKRGERAVEVGALAVEHVDEDDARELEALRAGPDPGRVHLDAHHAGDDDERALDDEQARDRVRLEARVAGRVDQVDLAPLPLEVRERRGERHLPLVLVLVPVADSRPGLDGAETVDGARLEEHRLHE